MNWVEWIDAAPVQPPAQEGPIIWKSGLARMQDDNNNRNHCVRLCDKKTNHLLGWKELNCSAGGWEEEEQGALVSFIGGANRRENDYLKNYFSSRGEQTNSMDDRPEGEGCEFSDSREWTSPNWRLTGEGKLLCDNIAEWIGLVGWVLKWMDGKGTRCFYCIRIRHCESFGLFSIVDCELNCLGQMDSLLLRLLLHHRIRLFVLNRPSRRNDAQRNWQTKRLDFAGWGMKENIHHFTKLSIWFELGQWTDFKKSDLESAFFVFLSYLSAWGYF